MFNQGFTVSGSSLKLLSVGERGVVAALRHSDDGVLQKLHQLGVLPGTSICLEQRFPQFIIRTETDRIALDELMIRAVYVRLTTNHKTWLNSQNTKPRKAIARS